MTGLFAFLQHHKTLVDTEVIKYSFEYSLVKSDRSISVQKRIYYWLDLTYWATSSLLRVYYKELWKANVNWHI